MLRAFRTFSLFSTIRELPAFTLNNLWDNPGSRYKSKIIGRGTGSGKGN